MSLTRLLHSVTRSCVAVVMLLLLLAWPTAPAPGQAAAAPGQIRGAVTAPLPPGPPVQIAIAQSFGQLVNGNVDKLVSIPGPGPFVVDDVPPGEYVIGAYMDLNANGRPDRELDPFTVVRSPLRVPPGGMPQPVVLDRFFNAEPRVMLAPDARRVLLEQAQFVYEATIPLVEQIPRTLPARRVMTVRQRLRNVLIWAGMPATEAEWQFLFREVRETARWTEELRAGRDPALDQRGPVRRAIHSAQYNAPWPYALYVPPDYDPSRAWPLFVVLHGAGGNPDAMLRTACGAGPWGAPALPGRDPFPPFPPRQAFVLCPFGVTTATPQDGFKQNVDEVLASLDAVQADYRIDPHRTYLTGISMGGGGAWRIGLTHPNRFAAIAPISGTLPLPRERAGDAPELPVVVIHGRHDTVIPIADVRAFVAAREAAGGRVALRERPDGDHYLDMFGMDDVFAELRAAGATRVW